MKHLAHSILTSIFVALIFLAGSSITFAQIPSSKVGAAFDFNQIKFDRDNPAEYLKGYEFDFAGKLAGDQTLLYFFANYKRKLDILQLDPMTYPVDPLPALAMASFNEVRRDTDNLHFGLRLAHRFGKFEPFVSAGVGTRFGNQFFPNRLSRLYQAGGDVNITKHVFLRAGADFQRVTGLDGVEQGFFVGGGFRFK